MLKRKANKKTAILVTTGIFNRHLNYLKIKFNFHPHVCNGCDDLLMMSMKLSDIALLNIKGADYCYIISGISKNEAINLMYIIIKSYYHT